MRKNGTSLENHLQPPRQQTATEPMETRPGYHWQSNFVALGSKRGPNLPVPVARQIRSLVADHKKDPTDVTHAILEAQQDIFWERADKHWLGTGIERGIDNADLRKSIKQLRNQGKRQEAGTLQAAA